MMLITFRYFADIPIKIHLFYDQAFDALFSKHDATKEGFKRKLNTDIPYLAIFYSGVVSLFQRRGRWSCYLTHLLVTYTIYAQLRGGCTHTTFSLYKNEALSDQNAQAIRKFLETRPATGKPETHLRIHLQGKVSRAKSRAEHSWLDNTGTAAFFRKERVGFQELLDEISQRRSLRSETIDEVFGISG